jgi:hypothetical protein
MDKFDPSCILFIIEKKNFIYDYKMGENGQI